MPALTTFLRRTAALAALAGIFAQSVLPAAHAWVVDSAEAAYHASDHGASDRSGLRDDHRRGHRHHSDADCPVCPLLAAARLGAAQGVAVCASPALASPLPAPALLSTAGTDVAGAPVRGPPSSLPA